MNKHELPTEKQKQELCEMMARAFIEMRVLGWAGKAEQVADLADAFHNLPREMYGPRRFDWHLFRGMLSHYQHKYYGEKFAKIDFATMLDRIRYES